tara:strand:- start:1656 stop:4610 length:2955 start_codon:yes stop_codon:yes gene_type:complete
MKLFISLLILLFGISSVSAADQCSAVFPNGASTHSDSGKISFGYNSRLIDSDDNLLATTSIDKNGGSNIKTCNSADCVAIGTPSVPASSINFQTTTSTEDVTLSYKDTIVVGRGRFSGNEFDEINPNNASEASITFSDAHSEYFIDKLVLAYKNTLYLQAGSTYWINQLSLNSQVEIIVQGSGTAFIYVNQNLSFPSPGLFNSPSINSSGDASKLVMHAFSDVTFNNNSTFTGSLYVGGDLTLGSSSYAFGAVSASNIQLGTDSTITYQSAEVAETDFGALCNNLPIDVHHYRIEHDAQGFTCEAETLTIKACVDENCDTLYDQVTAITLSPSGWDGDDTLVFTGELTTTLNVTNEGTFSLEKTSANPDVELYCFNGNTETCDITFTNDGIEFFGTTTANKTIEDQEAETNFSNVNIRAVRDEAGVCKALLEGPQDIKFIYNCDEPSSCLTSLGDIPINTTPSGDQSGILSVMFAEDGTAPMSFLNYADAGRLALTVEADIEGVTITSGTAVVDVYPTYLKLDVSPISLLDNSSNFKAGEPFSFIVGAYGALNTKLRNYEAGTTKLKVERVTPNSISANEGNFKYGDANTSKIPTNLAPVFTATSPSPLLFNDGEYRSEKAYYDEVGSIKIDIQDSDYFGNVIPSKNALTLGDFIPAYYTVTKALPELQNTCDDTFSYIGETIGFVTGSQPKLFFTGKNAQNAVTKNYGITAGTFSLSQLDVNNGISLFDSSSYSATDSANEVSKGSIPLITTGIADYDGIIEVQIPDTRFKYNKVRSDNTTFDIPSPFAASIDMEFSSTLLTDKNGVCYQSDYENSTCLPFTIANITGANMRYGRLVMDSTYGPETESLTVPFRAEYFDGELWLVNTEDNCTNIDFTKAGDEIQLTNNSLAALVGNVTSAGDLLMGVPVGKQFKLEAPGAGITGELKIWLNPNDVDVTWPTYLNYDWDGDGFINNINDFPEATVSFGLFRGNDRIIHWREVFN